MTEMTRGHKAGWNRLQRISCYHAAELFGKAPQFYNRHRQIGVPETIRENVEILGRGTEEDIKDRIWWYCTFHPAIVNATGGLLACMR